MPWKEEGEGKERRVGGRRYRERRKKRRRRRRKRIKVHIKKK